MKLSEYQKEVRTGVLLVLMIAALMTVLTWTGMLYPWQTLGVDAFLNSHNFRADEIRLISIGDEDYADKSLFKGRSPLRRDCVEKLIDTIAEAGPKLIVVDLDLSDTVEEEDIPAKPSGADPCHLTPVTAETKHAAASDEKLESFPAQVEDNIRSRGAFPLPRIIWAQTLMASTEQDHAPSIIPLAGLQPESAALPIFPSDRDGRVRSFWTGRFVNEYKNTSEGLAFEQCAFRLTVAGAVATKTDTTHEERSTRSTPCSGKIAVDEDEFYLRYSRDPNVFVQSDARSILTVNSDSLRAGLKSSLKCEIVIIGGGYGAARDTYFTPLGRMPGMKLIAFAIGSVVRNQKSREATEWGSFFADFVMGCTLVWVSLQKKWWAWARISLSSLLLCALPLVGSYLVYKSGNYFLNFMPVMLGAGLHTIYDSWSERLEKKFRKKYGIKHHEEPRHKKKVECPPASEPRADEVSEVK